MDKRQSNSLEMFKVMSLLFEKSETADLITPQVSQRFLQFKTVLDAINEQALKQEHSDTRGHTTQKNAVKDELVDLAADLALKMRAYAKIYSDDVLHQAVNYSKSDLAIMGQEQLLRRCTEIYNHASEKQAELGEFKVTPEKLSALHDLLERFKPLAGNRDLVADQLSTATDKLEQLFDEARRQLVVLDNLVDAVVDDKDFIATYHEARKITDRVGGKAEKG